MEAGSFSRPVEHKIFRSVRAAIVFDSSSVSGNDLASVVELYRPINVVLIPAEELSKASEDDFDVLGLLGKKALAGSSSKLEEFNCLKIGFYPVTEAPDQSTDSMRSLKATITCLGSRTLLDSLRTTMFHFYESLTLPSLLNIDLADVGSIARGIGISFNESGESADEIINHLPSQSFFARSALLHFTCAKDVTLEEVYSISKTISTRKNMGPIVPETPNAEQIKMYKRIRLKMGLRVLPAEPRTLPRISLTGILFGIGGKLWF